MLCPETTQYIICFDVTRLGVSHFKFPPKPDKVVRKGITQLDLTSVQTPTFFSQEWQFLHAQQDNAFF